MIRVMTLVLYGLLVVFAIFFIWAVFNSIKDKFPNQLRKFNQVLKEIWLDLVLLVVISIQGFMVLSTLKGYSQLAKDQRDLINELVESLKIKDDTINTLKYTIELKEESLEVERSRRCE